MKRTRTSILAGDVEIAARQQRLLYYNHFAGGGDALSAYFLFV